MKKTIKIILLGLFLMTAIAVGWTTYQFNTYRPRVIEKAVNPENLGYFKGIYTDCRKSFLDEALKQKDLYEGVEIKNLVIESNIDPDLSIDYCYIPAQTSFKRLFILTSAVHGVEGYAGSAVQQMFLRELVKEINLDEMGLLIIHAVNPFGFKNNRRVTENNVDLNRNCSTKANLYLSENKGYDELNSFLNQRQRVSFTSFGNFFFPVNAIQKILKYSMGTLRQAVLQGQYRHGKGVYYGGPDLEPSIKAVTPLIQQIAENYKLVFSIDLHTGYGENGTLHLFPSPLKDQKKKEKIETIFSGQRIDWGDSEDFYTVTGDFTSYLEQILPEKYYLTMTFEFGTLDTETTMGSIKALHNVMMENQGVHYGYKTRKDERLVKSRFLESYYPSSDAWRSKVIEDSRQTLSQVLKKYTEINAEDEP
ncbi:MAG: hypothetical protein A2277_12470 [Desulfobacterales bacterium RIFOXYA12_FULL_46_15]|nr:MAG: hypothetical protein A2097_10185 [Desulfobacula sp. GWF2_41_7]OGR24271.1 MAG: hypothetical protein A2277_12470 [Desulfobacterales bacterium RIFOXYA12_FULL_46_15]